MLTPQLLYPAIKLYLTGVCICLHAHHILFRFLFFELIYLHVPTACLLILLTLRTLLHDIKSILLHEHAAFHEQFYCQFGYNNFCL